VKNDWLDLRVPVWVTQLCFVPDTGNQPTIAVGTGYHQVADVAMCIIRVFYQLSGAIV